MARRLSDDERDLYDHVPRNVAVAARLHTVGWLPSGANGMTLSTRVLLRRGHEEDAPLIAHELVHVGQFLRTGRTRFLAGYLRDYLGGLVRLRNHRAAYRAIPAEVDARAATVAWGRRHPEAVGRAAGRAGGG